MVSKKSLVWLLFFEGPEWTDQPASMAPYRVTPLHWADRLVPTLDISRIRLAELLSSQSIDLTRQDQTLERNSDDVVVDVAGTPQAGR
jgi:hypothetical protein